MDNSLSAHKDHREKNIPVVGEDPIDGLDATAIIGEAKHSLNITMSRNVILFESKL